MSMHAASLRPRERKLGQASTRAPLHHVEVSGAEI
jgi:hypothetical protein